MASVGRTAEREIIDTIYPPHEKKDHDSAVCQAAPALKFRPIKPGSRREAYEVVVRRYRSADGEVIMHLYTSLPGIIACATGVRCQQCNGRTSLRNSFCSGLIDTTASSRSAL